MRRLRLLCACPIACLPPRAHRCHRCPAGPSGTMVPPTSPSAPSHAAPTSPTSSRWAPPAGVGEHRAPHLARHSAAPQALPHIQRPHNHCSTFSGPTTTARHSAAPQPLPDTQRPHNHTARHSAAPQPLPDIQRPHNHCPTLSGPTTTARLPGAGQRGARHLLLARPHLHEQGGRPAGGREGAHWRGGTAAWAGGLAPQAHECCVAGSN